MIGRSASTTRGEAIVAHLISDHNGLRQRLLNWEAALNQAAAGNYGQCRQAVHVLREVGWYLEHHTPLHFRLEEQALYPVAAVRLPWCRALVDELCAEHSTIRESFERFRSELAHFNSSGDLRELTRLGRELIRIVRRHVEREEDELHTSIRAAFSEDDWEALAELAEESQTV